MSPIKLITQPSEFSSSAGNTENQSQLGKAPHSERHVESQFQAEAVLRKAEMKPLQRSPLRRSTNPKTRVRAGTSCLAARAGGARLLASDTTQCTLRAGSVVLRPLPNPSIERRSTGKPVAPAHVKR